MLSKQSHWSFYQVPHPQIPCSRLPVLIEFVAIAQVCPWDVGGNQDIGFVGERKQYCNPTPGSVACFCNHCTIWEAVDCFGLCWLVEGNSGTICILSIDPRETSSL